MNKYRKCRKGWQLLVRTLALAVVFCTTYVLILPAITMQEDAVCGMEEHVHTDACYSQPQAQLTGCGIEADVVVHQHNDLCRNAAGELICTLAEQAVHVHEDSCHDMDTVLACMVTHVHSEACVKTESTQVCTLEESEGHAHSERCTGTQTVQVCTDEAHAHTEACVEVQTLTCEIPETAGHAHGETCFAVNEIPCTEPTAADHVHEEGCWQQMDKLVCGREELRLHTHGETCVDAEGSLICTLPVVVEHIHTDACLVAAADAEPVQTCEQQEHVHTEACYPLKEDAVIGPSYHCGYDAHNHGASCYELDETLKCSIPVHTHDTTCLLDDLDLTADLETAEIWEATLEDVELTGVWADDLLAVAKTQLGYRESEKNCILFEEELRGYTRYGAWYGNDYGKWDDMFIAFCLHYAEIDEESMPRESDTARWIQDLAEKNLYQEDLTTAPVPGDLVFLDTDEDEEADFAAIVAELLPENEIRIIAGDTEQNCVASQTLKRSDETLVGFGKLPENPNPEKTDVSALLAELPEADALKATLNAYQTSGDRTGFEKELTILTARLDAISTAYEALSDEEKAQVTGLEKLTALREACSSAVWQEISALTKDAAMISALTETAAQIQPSDESQPGVLGNQDSVAYQFTAETKAHDGESVFNAARVKVELVLPLTADKAVFDTAAMTWLEEAKLTRQTRTIGDKQITCQVLTGVKQLQSTQDSPTVVPGSFTETVKVNVLNADHNDQVFVLISAAMEQGDWNGICYSHQVEEKQTIQTTTFAVSNPLDPDDQQANYEAFKASIQALIDQNFPLEESIEIADQVQNDLDDAYKTGMLSYDLYQDLSRMVIYSLGDPNAIAEAAIGNFWKTEVITPRTNFTPKTEPEIPVAQKQEEPASHGLLRSRSIPTSSDGQILKEGGSNSAAGEIYVSKTIEGTDQENVFDITLEIVTQDRIETVYNEPDMAVVIVTDISNTMNTAFTGETTSRYQAAMDSAEEFIDRFQQEAGAVSRIGYVAFNTHAHRIFDLQTCDSPEKAAALVKEMNDDTADIIKASGYSSSHDRFTNIEAGLKLARDMLADVTNKNKFIVFLSDGFPTTYVKSGYTGYDPYTTSGKNGTDGVFYDAVMGVHCDYGTSYSDTAAIKARQMAVSIKNSGIDIFSIGVDVAGQTIKYYHDDSESRLKTASTVERRNKSYSGNIYEIGHWSTTSAFEDWLKGSASSGIGSGEGYYYSSTNTSGLHSAYDAIFEKIKILNGASSHLDWVVSDPMPGMGVHEKEDIEFIAFWDLSGSTLHESITGTIYDEEHGLYDENTVTFDQETQTISWDLKQSNYSALADEDGNQYRFQLKYRVRLQNEETGFVENQSYDTNDVTSMGYRLIEVSDGVTVIGERKYIDFPIPAVTGYLSELNFKKVNPLGEVVPDAEFLLQHDASCNVCRGDGKTAVSIADRTAKSGIDGMVTFDRIPSGHTYLLTETKAPGDYIRTENQYQVMIAYDTLMVTILDKDGRELEQTWDESDPTIVNEIYYLLPDTGGMGTSHFTFGGLLMVAASLVYICITGRKRRKGGRSV